MELNLIADYSDYGLDGAAQERLAVLGEVIQGAGLNVTGVKDPEEIEKMHFLDSLSLLKLAVVREADTIGRHRVRRWPSRPASRTCVATGHRHVYRVGRQEVCVYRAHGSCSGTGERQGVLQEGRRARQVRRSGRVRRRRIEGRWASLGGGRVLGATAAGRRSHGGDEGAHIRPRADAWARRAGYTGCRWYGDNPTGPLLRSAGAYGLFGD